MLKNILASLAAASFVLAPVVAQANTRAASSTTTTASGTRSDTSVAKSEKDKDKKGGLLLVAGGTLGVVGLGIALSNQGKSGGT